MITRRKDYTKQLPSKDARKLYIICEGRGTEPDYFSFFKGLTSNLEVITIPPENGTDPLKLRDLAEEKFIGECARFRVDYRANDSVWFVIDTDTWEEEGKIDTLRRFCYANNSAYKEKYPDLKLYSAWNVTQSNPSFEIWLYYHFFDKMPDRELLDSYPTFKSFVNGAIAGGFDYQIDPVRISVAIQNARANYKLDSSGKLCEYATEVFNLAEVIVPFVRTHLERLRGKML